MKLKKLTHDIDSHLHENKVYNNIEWRNVKEKKEKNVNDFVLKWHLTYVSLYVYKCAKDRKN